jgi:ribosomal protein S18 acetylase RimI-like enzyme
MTATHDSRRVAELIYQSAPEMFNLMFGQKAIPQLTNFVQHSRNRYSHGHIYVAEANHQVLGIATLVNAADLNDDTDYGSVLNKWERLRLWLAYTLILARVLQQDYPPQTVYIANLAVDARYRGRSIGTQLLQRCIADATAAGMRAVYISVDIDNPRAQKLYESLGFEVVAVKTMRLLAQTIGSRVLVLPLKPA